MSNRMSHDYSNSFNQLREELKMRTPAVPISKIVSNLEEVINVGILKEDIDKIVETLIKNPKFRENFLKNYQIAVSSIGIII